MKIRSCSRIAPLIALFLAFAASQICEAICAVPSSAAEPENQPPQSPIEIQADMMVTDSQGHSAVFSGNVIATQGETRLTADKLTIFYKTGSGAEPAGASDIERLDAVGHVRIMFDNKLAESNHAVYIIEKRKLVLEGPESKVVSGKDEIIGSRITFYRDDGRMTLESDDSSRVKAVIHSERRGLN